MKKFEVIVIGGGIIGTSVFSLLARNGVNVVLLEKEDDVNGFASKANSGIVHAGYDPAPNSLMAKFNVKGAKMYSAMCKRLGVDFNACGSLVVAKKQDKNRLEMLLKRGEQNGVLGLEILGKSKLKKLEPNLAEDIEWGLFAKTAGVVNSYELCVALSEEGILNGGKVFLNFEVKKITRQNNLFVLSDGKREIVSKFVINCAGQNCAEINRMAKAKKFDLNFVKGEYILLDKSEKGFVNRPIFPLPTEKGKGILANITTHGNILLGPTATVCEKEDTSVTLNGINQIKTEVKNSVKTPNFRKTIKLFAGVRVKAGSDFVVERDEKQKNFYYAVGICSPGLSSAPAIAEHFLKLLKQDGLKTKKIEVKKRTPYTNVEKLSQAKLNALIKKNPAYGKIVCRCEHISEGEILEALNSQLPAKNIDALKRRIRPTMGRCQGSFCLPKLIKILAKHYHINEEDVTLKGKGSEIIVSNIKQGGIK